jgi:hypothetical protein
LELVLPFDKVILEAMIGLDRPLDYLHHRSYFLLELRRVVAGEFTVTMNGDATCLVNDMATHIIYDEVNMESIDEMIPIDISRTPGVIEFFFHQRGLFLRG